LFLIGAIIICTKRKSSRAVRFATATAYVGWYAVSELDEYFAERVRLYDEVNDPTARLEACVAHALRSCVATSVRQESARVIHMNFHQTVSIGAII
jgi:hypothetical protein